MYCKECGKEIDNDSKFCRYCGKNQAVLNEESNRQIINKDVNISISLFNKDKKFKAKTDNPTREVEKKYDESYQKEIGASYTGSTLLIINIILFFSFDYNSFSLLFNKVSDKEIL